MIFEAEAQPIKAGAGNPVTRVLNLIFSRWANASTWRRCTQKTMIRRMETMNYGLPCARSAAGIPLGIRAGKMP